ncbi:MAG: hypothetical protein ACTJGH_04335 [Peptoniphilaceae bacterium]
MIKLLNDIVKIFQEENEKNNGKLPIREYRLSNGNYYLINLKDGKIIRSLEVNKDTEEGIDYSIFKEKDYYSNLLSMNKPVDNTKQIHSNNYLSFFVKKDKLIENKDRLLKSIDNFYDILLDKTYKYKKDKKEILESLNLEDRQEREEEILKIKDWVLNNIWDLKNQEDYKEDKNYLKIFFQIENRNYDLELIKNESKKYFMPNIYNTNDYNLKINEEMYGVSGNNFNLNSKKPFLLNKSKKNKVPNLISIDRALEYKNFFDYLYGLASNGFSHIYIGQELEEGEFENRIYKVKNKEKPDLNNFYGYYLRIKKGMGEAEIQDIEVISKYYAKAHDMKIINYLSIEDHLKIEEYYKTEEISLFEAITILDKSLFGNRFVNSFFLENKDISRDDQTLKTAILSLREEFVSWLYKGKVPKNTDNIDKVFFDLLIRHFKNGRYPSLSNGMNVREAFLEKLGSRRTNYMEIRDKLREKILNEEMPMIESQDEFLFAVGQLYYYILSRSESKEMNIHYMLPILKNTSVERIQDNINELIIKYYHLINFRSTRIKNLISMITSYKSDERINRNIGLLAGFTTKNILFEKVEKEDYVEEIKEEEN